MTGGGAPVLVYLGNEYAAASTPQRQAALGARGSGGLRSAEARKLLTHEHVHESAPPLRVRAT